MIKGYILMSWEIYTNTKWQWRLTSVPISEFMFFKSNSGGFWGGPIANTIKYFRCIQIRPAQKAWGLKNLTISIQKMQTFHLTPAITFLISDREPLKYILMWSSTFPYHDLIIFNKFEPEHSHSHPETIIELNGGDIFTSLKGLKRL